MFKKPVRLFLSVFLVFVFAGISVLMTMPTNGVQMMLISGDKPLVQPNAAVSAQYQQAASSWMQSIKWIDPTTNTEQTGLTQELVNQVHQLQLDLSPGLILALAELGDLLNQDGEAEKLAALLAPRDLEVEAFDKTVTTKTTFLKDGQVTYGGTTSTTTEKVLRIKKIRVFNGVYTFSYTMQSTSIQSQPSETTTTPTQPPSSSTTPPPPSLPVIVTTTVTTMPVLASRDFTKDETLLHQAMAFVGLYGQDDQTILMKQALAYDSSFTEPGGTTGIVSGMIPSEMMPWFIQAEKEYGIDRYVLAAIARKESTFNPNALGAKITVVCHGQEETVQAEGLMQFLPCTWDEYGVDANGDGKADPFEFQDAIVTGAKYIAQLGGGKSEDSLHAALYVYSGGDPTYADDIFAFAQQFKQYADLQNSPYLLYPLAAVAPVTSGYGDLEDRGGTPHKGIDFGAPTGTGVLAVAEGTVLSTLNESQSGGYGNLIIIQHDGYQTYYAHLSRIDVTPGQKVNQGTPIGAVGATGEATGPHLHFEVRIMSGGAWVTTDPSVLLKTGKPQ